LPIDNGISTPISVDSRGVSAVIDEDIDGVKAIPHVLVTKDENGRYVYASLGGSSSVTSDQITDASAVGKQVLTSADAPSARLAIGAGTSNLTIGTTGTTAKAGNYVPAWTEVTGKPTTFAPLVATTSVVGGVKQATDQINSTAPDVATLVTDFNALLAKLKAAGIMA
jgi:hypothetical protein